MVVVQQNRRCKRKTRRGGFTLVEMAVSILIIMVLATGAMGYQYHSTRDVKISEVQATAARLSMLLLEGWKGIEGGSDFDPVSTFDPDIDIEDSNSGPDVPESRLGGDFNLLGRYAIDVEGITYYVTLSWDEASLLEPLVLNCAVAWRDDYAPGQLQGDESFLQNSTFFVNY